MNKERGLYPAASALAFIGCLVLALFQHFAAFNAAWVGTWQLYLWVGCFGLVQIVLLLLVRNTDMWVNRYLMGLYVLGAFVGIMATSGIVRCIYITTDFACAWLNGSRLPSPEKPEEEKGEKDESNNEKNDEK